MQLQSQRIPYVCMVEQSAGAGVDCGRSVKWICADTETGGLWGSNRIQASDLRDAQRQSHQSTTNSTWTGPLFLEIEVLVDHTAAAARRQLAQLHDHTKSHDPTNGDPPPHGVRYIGTIQGLQSLIQDVWAVGIADGVVLLPLSPEPSERLIVEELPALLEQCGRRRPSDSRPRPFSATRK
jgi:hypothetical protein